jgi:acetylornithine deacetylase/succinyl-diaminopimelate desuccinylase-like protein
VGSAANHAARRYCADQLRSLGFEVAERPFVFSALPGRYAAQLIGATVVLGFLAARFLFAEWFGQLTAAAVIMLAYWFSSASATREPWFRESGVNLEARRGTPHVWLVAHIDSKSQPIPTAVRSLGVLLVAVGLAGQFIIPWPTTFYVYYLGIIGGLLLVMAGVGSNSNGAADNASGVAAVLEAAAMIPPSRPLGVLITDAEELSLAGARAWVAERSEKGVAVNCDTVDDDGRLTIIDYGNLRSTSFGDARVIGQSRLPGVLTDSNAFRAVGWPTVTLSRGTIRTLNRIHTRRDSLNNLRGAGIPEAANALARIVEELT